MTSSSEDHFLNKRILSTVGMSTLAKILQHRLRIGLLAIVTAVRIATPRRAGANCELAFSLKLHLVNSTAQFRFQENNGALPRSVESTRRAPSGD
jgi:hypothetical protein